MKKYFPIIICIVIGAVLCPLCLGYNQKNYPNEYYNVYLDEELLGTVKSKDALLSYIEEKTDKIINIETVVKTYCEDYRSLELVIIKENLTDIITDQNTTYYTKDGKECVDIKLKSGTEIEQIYKPIGLEI